MRLQDGTSSGYIQLCQDPAGMPQSTRLRLGQRVWQSSSMAKTLCLEIVPTHFAMTAECSGTAPTVASALVC